MADVLRQTQIGGVCLVVVLVLLAVSGCAVPPAQPLIPPYLFLTSYTNPVYLWSISYPSGWAIDSKDPSFVRIGAPVEGALCCIHSRAVRFKTVDEFTDFMLGENERFFRGRGQAFVILKRQRISVPNDVIGNDVLVEIGPGGKSRRIFILADGRGLIVDCETYIKNWERLEAGYGIIISSFTLGK
mgnify:CR=1 FL=1